MPHFEQTSERPLAHLPTIHFSQLERGDAKEIQKLFAACQTHGFFYLDLSNTSYPIVKDKNSILDVMGEYFSQPLSTKMEDDRKNANDEKDHTVGYKPTGYFAGVEPGQRESYESLKVSRFEARQHSVELPAIVKKNPDLFERYINNAQHVTMTMLACLSDALRLTGEARLEQSHREQEPTRTTLVMLRYPRQTAVEVGAGHNKHTDIGSFTFLFSDQWGLQVISPDAPDKWLFVEPRTDQAIINVGDSLRFLSGNKLNSCVHRVIPTTELQNEHRFSLAYFLRPEDNAIYKDSRGRLITAKQWHDGKYDAFAQDHKQQEQDSILTGGMEKGEMLVM